MNVQAAARVRSARLGHSGRLHGLPSAARSAPAQLRARVRLLNPTCWCVPLDRSGLRARTKLRTCGARSTFWTPRSACPRPRRRGAWCAALLSGQLMPSRPRPAATAASTPTSWSRCSSSWATSANGCVVARTAGARRWPDASNAAPAERRGGHDLGGGRRLRQAGQLERVPGHVHALQKRQDGCVRGVQRVQFGKHRR